MKQASILANTFFRQQTHSNFQSIGLLIIRFVAGFGILLHGLPKLDSPMSFAGDNFPGFLQLLAVISEDLGGICIALGLLTPLATLGISITMFTAIFMMHVPFHDPFYRITVHYSFEGEGTPFFRFPWWFARADGHSPAGSGSAELALLYLIIGCGLFFTGPGKFSLDSLIRKRSRLNRPPATVETR